MKKVITSISKIAGILTIAALVVSCNKGQTKSADSKTSSSTNNSESIVYVNSDSLLTNYEYFKAVQLTFQEKSKKAQADLTAKGAAFQREVAAYQQNAGSLSADQRASTEERLARKQQELATYNQNAGNALSNEEAVDNEKL
jgi:outer membrane protein